jgi:acyl-CoA synthetase (NDP forming)
MSLDRLLRPRSIAILGASERPSVGRTLVEALEGVGFRGEVYPVNPRYETLLACSSTCGPPPSAASARP